VIVGSSGPELARLLSGSRRSEKGVEMADLADIAAALSAGYKEVVQDREVALPRRLVTS
jgi:hypothetical protein